MIGFYWLNRERGKDNDFAKINGLLFGFAWAMIINDSYIGFSMALLYWFGESMGWGDWVGQLLTGTHHCGDEGEKNGIKWLSSLFFKCGSTNYNMLSLTLRGMLWWGLTLSPLCLVMNAWYIVTATVLMGIGFTASVLIVKDWNGALLDAISIVP